MARSELIPDSFVSAQGVGQFDKGSQGSGGAAVRGGANSHGVASGVFSMNIEWSPTNSWGDFGFRCVRF